MSMAQAIKTVILFTACFTLVDSVSQASERSAKATLGSSTDSSVCCPFCESVKQTIRQEMESMDAVAIGILVPNPKQADAPTKEVADGEAGGPEFSGIANFQVISIIKGNEMIEVGQVISAPYFGSPKKNDKRYLLQGVDPAQLVWSTPLPLTPASEAYMLELPNLPTDTLDRLKFFMKHLEHEDSLLSRDAYDEFAISPYDQIKLLKSDLDRKLLLEWLSSEKVSVDRKRLYFTLLGICGQPEDADFLEARMRSENPDNKAGLDALIACYLTLKGDAGIPLVEELFLANKQSPYPETYSAIMAMRFHGTEGGVLDRKRVVQAVQALLDRPEMADLVIPDLARWEDWSQIDKLVKLFIEADESSSWVRMPVVNYLRACPLPVAAEKLIELEKIDPKTIQRAKTFFPIPLPGSKTTFHLYECPHGYPQIGQPTPEWKLRCQNLLPRLDVENDPRLKGFLPGVSQTSAIAMLTSEIDQLEPQAEKNLSWLNLGKLGVVSCSMATTLGLSMWLVLSGGNPK